MTDVRANNSSPIDAAPVTRRVPEPASEQLGGTAAGAIGGAAGVEVGIAARPVGSLAGEIGSANVLRTGTTEAPDQRLPASTDGASPHSASLRPVDDGRNPEGGDLPHAIVNLSSSSPSSAPAMPHERDETVGMTGGIPSGRVEQARADLEKGREDTSRGAEADETYQRLKNEVSSADGDMTR